MKALILAGGYGTRLEHDLICDKSDTYKHLIGVPKPLLPIGGVTLVSRWMKILDAIECKEQVYIVVSLVYKIVCDATCQNQAALAKKTFKKLALFMFLGHTNLKLCVSVHTTVDNLCKITELRKNQLKVKILHNLLEF